MTRPKVSALGLVVFLVALSLLNAQVTVTRLLAYRFFYHFVFFVISLAQLGLAGSGAWLYASKRSQWSTQDLTRWLMGLATCPLLVLLAYGWASPLPNVSHAKLDGQGAYSYLSLLAVLLVALNFCGGIVLTMVFTMHKEKIDRLYASDLLGAALGCIGSVALMQTAGPIRAFALSACIALVAQLFLQRGSNWNAPRIGIFIAVATGLAISLSQPQLFDPDVRHPEQAQKTRRSEWTQIARVDEKAPFFYVIDGDASTNLAEEGPNPPVPEYQLITKEPDVAIVGVGAGPQLLAARKQNAKSVLAIDLNQTILKWAQEEDKKQGFGIFSSPPVTVKIGEGRHTLRAQPNDFDLVVMHAIDTYTASSQGAYSLTENFLYTSEAMQDFLSKLRPSGVLSIRRWLFWPPRENLRLFTTLYDALSQIGAEEPGNHLVVISPQANYRDPNLQVWGYVFASKEAFTEERLAPLDEYLKARNWVYLYRPGQSIDTPFTQFVSATDKNEFYSQYPYTVTPAVDRNPFFFQFTTPSLEWFGVTDEGMHDKLYSNSSTTLILCFALCTALTLVVVGVPLYMRREDFQQARTWSRALIYFACLGLGFMAFELPIIQVMTLLLGHPTYALSVVLCGLLVSAGLGSTLCAKIEDSKAKHSLPAIVILGLVSAFGLLPLVHQLIHLPDIARLAFTFLYLLLVGVPLGMPFVAGVRALERERPHLVSGAWAINGACGVLGSCLVMMLMVFSGSSTCFLLASVVYGVAMASGHLSAGTQK